MSFWKKIKQKAMLGRLVEEKLYEQVLREIESGIRRDGLWAKAIQNSNGNDQEAKALYIRYRVQSLKDEIDISNAIGGGASRSEIESSDVSPEISVTGNPIDVYDKNGYTPLMRAVKAMDCDEVASLLRRGANPKVVDGNIGTSTALNMAKLLLIRAKTPESRQAFQKIVELLEPVT